MMHGISSSHGIVRTNTTARGSGKRVSERQTLLCLIYYLLNNWCDIAPFDSFLGRGRLGRSALACLHRSARLIKHFVRAGMSHRSSWCGLRAPDVELLQYGYIPLALSLAFPACHAFGKPSNIWYWNLNAFFCLVAISWPSSVSNGLIVPAIIIKIRLSPRVTSVVLKKLGKVLVTTKKSPFASLEVEYPTRLFQRTHVKLGDDTARPLIRSILAHILAPEMAFGLHLLPVVPT